MKATPAKKLREALHSGNFLKDRLSVKLDNDMRNGEVQFDHYYMRAKVVDMPCIIESLKTVDNKSFYKTADISQMLVCKEEDDLISDDDENSRQSKKKDPNKLDKKYISLHGVTPLMKNVRHRRFRKMLRKKHAEAPEIEKEVKRLLRGDCDAVSIKWEIVTERGDSPKPTQSVPIKQESTLADHNVDDDDDDEDGNEYMDSQHMDVDVFREKSDYVRGSH